MTSIEELMPAPDRRDRALLRCLAEIRAARRQPPEPCTCRKGARCASCIERDGLTKEKP